LLFHQDLVESAYGFLEFLTEALSALLGGFLRILADATGAASPCNTAISRTLTALTEDVVVIRCGTTNTFTGLTHAAYAAGQCAGVAAFAAGSTLSVTVTVAIGIAALTSAFARITVGTASALLTGRRWNTLLIIAGKLADVSGSFTIAATRLAAGATAARRATTGQGYTATSWHTTTGRTTTRRSAARRTTGLTSRRTAP
jgi:hypothetical protein